MKNFFAAIRSRFKGTYDKDEASLEKSKALMQESLKYKQNPRHRTKPIKRPNMRMNTRSQQKT